MNQKILKYETQALTGKRPPASNNVKLWFHYIGVERVSRPKIRFEIDKGEQINVYPDPDVALYICGRFKVETEGFKDKIQFDPSVGIDKESRKYYRMILCRDPSLRLFFLAVDTELDTWESAVAANLKRYSLKWISKDSKEGEEVFKLVHSTRRCGKQPWPDPAGVRALLEAAIGMRIEKG